jgi:hypothetical protein
MLSGFSFIHSSRLWRAACVASVLVVFVYVLFDVLDLDGSNFPRLFTPVERTIIVAFVPSGIELNYSFEESELCGDLSTLLADRSEEYSRPPCPELFRTSPLGMARGHRYRVGLARNSLPDSSPYW